MSRKQETKPTPAEAPEPAAPTLNKKFALLALAIFTIVSSAIVLLHAFPLGHGFDLDMTISKYVGLAPWSAIVFLIANLFLAYAWIKYAISVRDTHKMPKIWFYLAVAAAVMLVMLSLCPMGLFDETPGQLGLISTLHRFSSTTMFAIMVVTSIGFTIHIKNPQFRILTATYAICGIIMAVLYLTGNDWFWSNALPFESSFLFIYLLILCLLPAPQTPQTPQTPPQH